VALGIDHVTGQGQSEAFPDAFDQPALLPTGVVRAEQPNQDVIWLKFGDGVVKGD
jgi:hypothetical protein